MKQPIAVTFIFVNYRSADFLGAALRSLVPLREALSSECIVVNNDASEKEKLQILHQKYRFELIETETNIGFGAANNLAAEKAQGSILFFLNPDVELAEGKIENLLVGMEAFKKTIYGCALRTKDGYEPWAHGKKPTLARLFLGKFWSETREASQPKKQEVDWVSGAAVAIHRDFFRALGGFDEHFFLYYEDVDLCLRAKAAGGRIFWYPFLSFYHARGKSHQDFSTMKSAYFESQRRYFKKHGTKTESFLLTLLQPLYRKIRY